MNRTTTSSVILATTLVVGAAASNAGAQMPISGAGGNAAVPVVGDVHRSGTVVARPRHGGATDSASCYINCDDSTTLPCVNLLDFVCFLNAYAAGDSYANCDGSTAPPTINVNDFACFLNLYALGCTSC